MEPGALFQHLQYLLRRNKIKHQDSVVEIDLDGRVRSFNGPFGELLRDIWKLNEDGIRGIHRSLLN